ADLTLSSSRLSFIEYAPIATATSISSASETNSPLQDDPDAMSGPMTGPSTMPAMPAPRHNNQASWRVEPCMVDTRTPPVAVRTNPALRPMNARTATSDHKLATVKPSSAATEKATPPIVYMRLRPRMSANQTPDTAIIMRASV